MTEIKTASFEFAATGEELDIGVTVVVKGENLADAMANALNLLGTTTDMVQLTLGRVVDSDLLVNNTNVFERKVVIEEHHIDTKVAMSGEITENRREVK